MNKIKSGFYAFAVYGILLVIMFFSLFPFLWMLISATNTSIDIINGKFSFGGALFNNFSALFNAVDMPLILWNTAKIATLHTFFGLLISSIAGYGFEVLQSRPLNRLFFALLFFMMVPFSTVIVPLFIMTSAAGFIDTHTAVILPAIASIFIIFYFRQASKSFVLDLRSAAKIDGLKEWQIFLFIYLPVMRSTFAAGAIIIFMASWNNYLWPLIVLHSNEKKTITLVIASLLNSYFPDYGVVMVATIFAILPILIFFILFQRFFVKGLVGVGR